MMRMSEIRHELCIQQIISQWLHARQCTNPNCHLFSCRNMKRVDMHSKTCRRSTMYNCNICRNLRELCIYHAERCQNSECLVPYCLNLKQMLLERQRRYATRMKLARQEAMKKEII